MEIITGVERRRPWGGWGEKPGICAGEPPGGKVHWGRSGARSRPHGHASRYALPGTAGAADLRARPPCGRSVRLSRPQGGPDQDRLARRDWHVPLREEVGEGTLHLALAGRRLPADLRRSAGLHARRNRLAEPATNLQAGAGGIVYGAVASALPAAQS